MSSGSAGCDLLAGLDGGLQQVAEATLFEVRHHSPRRDLAPFPLHPRGEQFLRVRRGDVGHPYIIPMPPPMPPSPAMGFWYCVW